MTYNVLSGTLNLARSAIGYVLSRNSCR